MDHEPSKVEEKTRILAIQPSLPMSNEYSSGVKNYWIRDCYRRYYEEIAILCIDKIRPVKYVTVTGTPGIGESVFYQYFFRRYRDENPDDVIVTASFGRDRLPLRCWVHEPGKSHRYEGYRGVAHIDGAVYLFDGPPWILSTMGQEDGIFHQPARRIPEGDAESGKLS